MLKKTQRLTKNKEFETVLKTGKAFYCPILLVKCIKNNLTYSRLGLIVSNKISKKASQRNLIKRRIREIIRLALPKIKKGVDMVIIVSPKIINQQKKVLAYQEIEQAINLVLKKANLL